MCLVGLRWRTHEGEVVLSLPMGLKEEKAEELAVYARGGACDGGQERDAVISLF